MNRVEFKELKVLPIFTQTEQHISQYFLLSSTISRKIEHLKYYQQRAKDSISNFSYHHQTHTYEHQILSIQYSKKKAQSKYFQAQIKPTVPNP